MIHFGNNKHQKENKIVLDFDQKIGKMFGFQIFSRGMPELLKEIENDNYQSGTKWIATVNPEFVMLAEEQVNFKKLLKKTWKNVPDGVGIVWAMELLKRNMIYDLGFMRVFGGAIVIAVEILKGKNREMLVPGVELIDELCKLAEKKGKSVYFYGGWEDRAKRTADFFVKKYPGLKVTGYSAENFDFSKKIDFLFVARGMKKQEEWIEANLDKLRVGVVVGVGRSFDYYSGELKRAPEWVRKRGMEWLYSLWKQPERWRRQLRLPKFVWFILRNLPRI